MNHELQTQLLTITEKMSKLTNMGGFCNLTNLESYWSDAVYYNKIQNQFIKDGYPDDMVKEIMSFDPSKEEVVWFNVKAKQKLTRIQWFKLLAGSGFFYLNIEQLRTIVKEG